jgi:hypothetical protein
MHYFMHEDGDGDLVDVTGFCSDWCHQCWCREHGLEYGGWNGAYECDGPEWCARCGSIAEGGESCDTGCWTAWHAGLECGHGIPGVVEVA